LPLSYIFTNIYLIYQLAKLSYFSPRVQGLIKARNERGIPGKMTVGYNQCDPEVLHLVPALRQTDWPFSVIPPNMVGCGPILPPSKPLVEVDPELARWLAARPTVIINMGSHVTYDAEQGNEVMSAIQQCVSRHTNVQVLWKCRKAAQPDPNAADALLDPRIRLVSWLPATPVACLMASQSVLAYVHHGGSNSFHEAIAAGVPQVVCPVWIDTYEFATRAEMLGIGVRGNETAAPYVRAEELARALEKVVGDGAETREMREKAKRLADEVGCVDTGRKTAADQIKRRVLRHIQEGIVAA
jgi:UDP:flavonoid glycosyltransferase YjiC (YdhE family)